MHLRSIEIKQSPPVQIALRLEHVLSGLECVERLSMPAHLKQGDAQKGRRFGFFIMETDFFELFGSPPRQGCCLPGEVQLDINFRFIQIAQRVMPAATRPFEMLTKPAE